MASLAHVDGYRYNPYKVHFYDRLVSTKLFGFLVKPEQSPSTRQFLQHLPLNTLVFFALIALFTFGPGYQPIAFIILPALAVLLAYTRSAPTYSHVFLVAYPAVSIGTFLAYAGTFSYENLSPWHTWNTAYSLIIGVSYGALIIFACVLDRMVSDFSFVLLPFVEIFFAFPFIWTGVWSFVGRVSPFGDFFNWGTALAIVGVDDLTVGVTWLFGAIPGGCLVLGTIVSTLLYCLRRYFEVCHPKGDQQDYATSVTPPPYTRIRDIRIPFLHPALLVVYIMSLIFGFGSIYRKFAPQSEMFFQTPINEWAPETVQMSCLINGSYASTINHLETGGKRSKFVIWSERSASVANESVFLQQGLSLAATYKVYLGVSYTLRGEKSQDNIRNRFALLAPPSGNRTQAEIALIQQKVHPVPLTERNSEPGPRYFEHYDTPYGRVGAAIGFDFDYATFGNSYYNNFAIMFQPAQTWGPISEMTAHLARLRSVENGFTTFRCAANGISGVYDPFYRALSQKITLGEGDEFVYAVPVIGRRWTLVRTLLDCVAVMCMTTLLFWILFLGGWAIKRVYGRNQKRPTYQDIGPASGEDDTDMIFGHSDGEEDA
jgi:hypothetical protein